MNMQTNQHNNRAILRGVAMGCPTFSHEDHGISYHTLQLMVPRLSGIEDKLNLMIPHTLLEGQRVEGGTPLEVEGEIRSFNNKSGRGSRLVIYFFVRHLAQEEGAPVNELTLTGVLCKAPILRSTPLGRHICDLMLAVNRRYGRADYLPCIAWGSLAKECGAFSVGAGVTLRGRLQSREYTKVENGESVVHTAYEISVMEMEQAEVLQK